MMPTTGKRRRVSDWEEEIGHFVIILEDSVKQSSVGIAVLIIWRRIREKR